MKRFFFSMIVLCSSLSLQAQGHKKVNAPTVPGLRNLIVEEFTGIGCGYCPGGHKAVNDLMTQNPGRVWAINIHEGMYASGSPDLTSSFGTALFNQSGAGGYPAATFNRQIMNKLTTTSLGNYPEWAQHAPTVLNDTSPLNIAAVATINWETRELSLEVDIYYTKNEKELTNYLNIAVLQNNIIAGQNGKELNPSQITSNGLYIHKHALRHLITGQWGDSISNTRAGRSLNRTYTYSIPEKYKTTDAILEDLEFVVFVTQGHQYIIQGVNAQINYLNIPTEYVTLNSGGQLADLRCESNVDAYVIFENKGTHAVNSIKISTWAGKDTLDFTYIPENPIPSGSIDSVKIGHPTNVMPNISRKYYAQIKEVNNIPYNKLYYKSFLTFNVMKNYAQATAGDLRLLLYQDRWGSDITWEAFNAETNASITSGGPYEDLDQAGTFKNEEIIPAQAGSCIRFEIYDENADGINGSYGAGYYLIKDPNNVEIVNGNGKYGKGEIQFIKISQVSVERDDLLTEKQIKLYPNPSVNNVSLNVKLSKKQFVEIQIFDLAGKKVYIRSKAVYMAGDHTIELPTGRFESGVYMIRIAMDNQIVNRKLIIQ